MRHQQSYALQEKPYWLVDICFSFQNTIRICCTMYNHASLAHFCTLGLWGLSLTLNSHCGKSKSLKVT